MSDRPPSSIQVLIADINRILRQPLAVWRLYSQAIAQRQLLERTREVLALWPTSGSSPGLSLQQPAPEGTTTGPETSTTSPETSLANLASSLLAPLQTDIQTLTTQRQALQQEVAQLEQTKQLQQQQIAAPLIQQVEQLEAFHDRANQILQSLDGSLKLTFTSLEQDAASYQRSLANRLSQLYEMGEQSETVIADLLQQLVAEIQQLAQSPTPATLRAADQTAIAAQTTATSPEIPDSAISRSAESSPPRIDPATTSASLEQATTATVASPDAPETIASLTILLSELGLAAASPPNSPPP